MATIKKSKGSMSPKPKMKKRETTPPEFELAKELSVPSSILGEYVTLLFGERKIGKTSMLAEYPKAYFMMFEPGGKSLRIHQDAYVRWSQVKKGLALVKTDSRFDMVVMDTVDRAFRLCEKYVCKKLGIDHVSDAEWGKGWAALREEFDGTVTDFLQSGKGVVFISHATEREIRTRGGDKYDMITSTMAKMPREIIEGLVDIWAYYGYEGRNRVLWIRGNDHIAAGNRLTDNFIHDGKPIEVIPMGSSSKESWKNFVDAFNNRLEIEKPKTRLRIAK